MAFTNIIDIIYPIGSLYFTSSTTSPATTFGGTWVKVQEDFYPETLMSASNRSTQGTASSDVFYTADVMNGNVCFGVTFGSNGNYYYGGKNSYDDIAWQSFLFGNTTSKHTLGVKTGTYAHSMGGKSPQNYSGWMVVEDDVSSSDSNPALVKAYNSSLKYDYGCISGQSTVYIPTRTHCYIWRRTA